jgi:RNA polymerase sigma-70 factor, ECF subfamily
VVPLRSRHSVDRVLPLSLGYYARFMNRAPAGEITTLLHAWSNGDSRALAELTPLVYRELHHAAKRCMAHERPGHLLQSTALVNEMYLRLAHLEDVAWEDRNHFYAFCAQAMRHILVDQARIARSTKRGANADHVPIDEALGLSNGMSVDFLALNEALERLSLMDKRKSLVVELRFFGGLSVKETADVLDVSEDTVIRDWRFAKGWLLSKLNGTKLNGD